MNKRGAIKGLGVWLVWVLVVVAILSAVAVYLTGEGSKGLELLSSLPEGIQYFFEIISSIFGPILKAIYYVVTPAGQDENVQIIAFGIFILLFFVGQEALSPWFKNKIMVIVIAFVVGMIAGRSLTATILEETAIAASPITAVALILGFVPIFAITKNINKWGLSKASEMIVFFAVAVTYLLTLWYVFNAPFLGYVYGIAVALLGMIETIAPYYREKKTEAHGQSLGRYLASVHKDIVTAEGMHEGHQEAESGGSGI